MISTDERSKGWLLFAGGIVATIALVVGVVSFWPDGGDDDVTSTGADATSTTAKDKGDTDGKDKDDEDPDTTTPGDTTGEPSDRSTTTTEAVAPGPVDLFTNGADGAIAAVVAESGSPTQAIEILVYDTYAFLAYRDPANPGNIDRRGWRDGQVDDASPNPIDDRVNADTEPSLFALSEVNLAILPGLTADAPSHYDIPVEVTHVIINRFLPFDERVLIRVYASPTDGRSGGGYVSYDTAGTFVGVCC